MLITTQKMPIKYLPSKIAHYVINWLAWKIAPTSKPGAKKHWLWRLNNWVANPWINWWVNNGTGKNGE